MPQSLIGYLSNNVIRFSLCAKTLAIAESAQRRVLQNDGSAHPLRSTVRSSGWKYGSIVNVCSNDFHLHSRDLDHAGCATVLRSHIQMGLSVAMLRLLPFAALWLAAARHVATADLSTRNHMMFPWLSSAGSQAMCLSVPGFEASSFAEGLQTLLPSTFHLGASQVRTQSN